MFIIDKNVAWRVTTYSIYDTNSCSKMSRLHLYRLLVSGENYHKEYLNITNKLYKKFGCNNRGVIMSLRKNDITSFLNFLVEKKFLNNYSMEANDE